MGAAFAFLTVFGRGESPTPRALRWFPLVGAVIGTLVGVVWWGLEAWLSPAVVAALVVAADAALTGLLHYDGLADSGDGLLPPFERERRLAVMRAPDVGAFGAVTLIVVLLARWSAVASFVPGAGAMLVTAALWATSRTVMAVVTFVVPYARAQETGGIATAFMASDAGRSGRPPGWLALALTLAVVVGALGSSLTDQGALAGGTAVVAAMAAGWGVVIFARRRLGGFTGDVLGAVGVIAETVGLIVWTARW